MLLRPLESTRSAQPPGPVAFGLLDVSGLAVQKRKSNTERNLNERPPLPQKPPLEGANVSQCVSDRKLTLTATELWEKAAESPSGPAGGDGGWECSWVELFRCGASLRLGKEPGTQLEGLWPLLQTAAHCGSDTARTLSPLAGRLRVLPPSSRPCPPVLSAGALPSVPRPT